MTTDAHQAGRDAYWDGVDYVPSCYHGAERNSYVAGYQAAEDEDDDWDEDETRTGMSDVRSRGRGRR